MAKDKVDQVDLDELRKSLENIGLPEEDIQKAMDTAKQNVEEDEDKGESVGKAYGERMAKLEKSVDGILKAIEDMKGLLPGSTAKPDTSLKKGEGDEFGAGDESELEKSMDKLSESFGEKLGEFTKGFGDKFEEFSKGFEEKFGNIQEQVNKIADAPNPLKGLMGNYQNDVIHKGIEKNEEGQEVFNKGLHKSQLLGKMWDLVEKSEGNQKDMILKAIPSFENTGNLPEEIENIMKSELNIDIEK